MIALGQNDINFKIELIGEDLMKDRKSVRDFINGPVVHGI